MNNFDDIRPYNPDELQDVYTRLLNAEGFKVVLATIFPNVPMDDIEKKMRACKTNLEFQKDFCAPFLQGLVKKLSTGIEMDSSAIDITKRHTFVSNHRDIILDSAFLSLCLLLNGCDTTVEIGIGDNLLIYPWIRDLVRLNKSFIVQRGLSLRETLLSSKHMSEYMHYAINEKHENLWIAQREGRSKDSSDITQPSILKMMAMGGNGSMKERLIDMHICPLCISYEYDPCDYLKAKEFQLKRDDPNYKKQPQDDLINMQTGLMGYKGHIHFQCTPCIDEYVQSLPDDMQKSDFFDNVAAHINKEIHRSYRIYSVNRIAYDLLEGNVSYDGYTDADKKAFDTYVSRQVSKVDLMDKDDAFLRDCILKMYANPLRNFQKAIGRF
ncbi:MAG: acyltransferase [Bacteroidaceae bacterium]|nr:acyltransferase [Bacteroidaceae bacterium]